MNAGVTGCIYFLCFARKIFVFSTGTGTAFFLLFRMKRQKTQLENEKNALYITGASKRNIMRFKKLKSSTQKEMV